MAIHTSLTQRTVSHLSIPSDLFDMTTSATPYPRMHHSKNLPNPSSVQKAAEVLKSAKYPMILVGTRAESTSAEPVCQLAEKWAAGILQGHGALGVVPGDVPYLLGDLGPSGHPLATSLFNQADVVLVIGSSYLPKRYSPKVRIVQVDPYTSNLGKGVPTEMGLTGEVHTVIPLLLEQLQDHIANMDWIQKIYEAKPIIQEQINSEKNQPGSPIPPARIIKAVEENASAEAVIALDTGDAAIWFMRTFQASGQTILLSDHWRTMGFGLPAALAAKLCVPDKQFICFTGDGGLEMVLADLMTAVRYECPITVVLLNNQTLQMEREKSLISEYIPEATDLTNPSFTKMAQAFGWETYKVTSEDQLEPMMQQAFQSNKPAFLDIDTARIPYPNQQTT